MDNPWLTWVSPRPARRIDGDKVPGFTLIDRSGYRPDQLFYADDSLFLLDVADHLVAGIERGGSGVAFVTAAHAEALGRSLGRRGFGKEETGPWFFSAEETIEELLVEGRLSAEKFFQVLGATLDAVATPVHVYSELAGVFWEAGELSAVVEVENLWRQMQEGREFSLLTGYSADTNGGERASGALEEALGVHASLLGAGGSAPELHLAIQARSRAFPPEAGSPARVRAYVRQVLGCWGSCRLEEAVLVASELSTNAVVHAGSSFSVVLALLDEGVRVSVRDEAPFSDDSEPSVDTVHGLGIVARVSSSWGIERHDQGKTVWSELRDR